MFEERKYRKWIKADGFEPTLVSYKESDLYILARENVGPAAEALLLEARNDLEEYIARDQKFQTTLEPYDVYGDAPLIVKKMAAAASRYGVGPMAAVAGAVSDYVGEQLALQFGDVIVENGGDIFLRCERPVTFGLYAGEKSPFTDRIRFRVRSNGRPLGVCTSSGTVGHSFSFGKADALCAICPDAALADAAATALCNTIKKKTDIEDSLARAQSFKEISGVIAAMDDKIGVWGEIELIG